MSKFRLCQHAWSSCDGKPGSNHGCGLDRGHIGPHECLDCNATDAGEEAEEKTS